MRVVVETDTRNGEVEVLLMITSSTSSEMVAPLVSLASPLRAPLSLPSVILFPPLSASLSAGDTTSFEPLPEKQSPTTAVVFFLLRSCNVGPSVSLNSSLTFARDNEHMLPKKF
ncbi:hypothetical protein ES332_A08G036700v1 [Gossypium tomentosum]|uniref:Uncharacterized protein n=1 Tax=Gossypium tomentosum TaxID=34277 RepID=A0A5D2PCU6_GOSTO|nr:hypothetical protein ES332_A08G036700v1 [Gossypium tomentosum]